MAISTKLLKSFRPFAPLLSTLANNSLFKSKAFLTSAQSPFSCESTCLKKQFSKYTFQLNTPGGLTNLNYPHFFWCSDNTLSFFKGFTKHFTFKRKDKGPKKQKKRVPKLILLQNPLKWLMIKIDFSVLKNIWDSTFEEKEFKYGTKQAISRVTHIISEGQYSELNGLLTKAARLSLMRELDRNWSDKQRYLLALNLEDIQISSPRKVYFIRIADKKYCDVDMAFLALKWVPINDIEALIFTEIFARFHREFTPHCIPEWTIAYFKVTRFELVRR